jgi:hypothetical protein
MTTIALSAMNSIELLRWEPTSAAPSMRSSESIGLLNICFYSALLRCAITRTGERLLPYSKPTTGSSWLDPFKHERQIHLETILTYMDEIHGVSAFRRVGVSAYRRIGVWGQSGDDVFLRR